MKKTLALLLALSMLFSLCACGGSAGGGSASGGAAPAAETEPTPEPTPEKTYVNKTVWLPVKVTEEGVADYRLDDDGPVWYSGYRVTEYSYDEYGNTTGETVSFLDSRSEQLLSRAENAETYPEYNEDVAVERSEAGELVSVSSTGETYRPFFGGAEITTKDTAYFENGRVTRVETVTDNNGMTAREITAEYYPGGALKREVTSDWVFAAAWAVYTFTEPLVSVREFNEDGRCTLLHTEDINLDTDQLRVKEYSWKYDGDGNPVSMNYWAGTANTTPITDPEVTYTLASEMHYDAQGRMTSSTILVNDDPSPVEFTYRYDGDGRLTAYDAAVGDSVLKEEFEYGENGLLSVQHSDSDGDAQDYSYTWEKGDYALEGTTTAPDARSVFSIGSMSVYSDVKDGRGNVTRAYSYVLQPSASTLFPVYMDKTTEYEYEEFSILVDAEEIAAEEAAAAEAAAAAAEAASAAGEAEYNALKESLLAEGMRLVADDGRLLVAALDQDCVFCLSGLALQDVYTVNKEGRENRLEYGWSVDFAVDGVPYSIGTTTFCFAPGQNDQKSLDMMQSNMWIDYSYAQKVGVEMSHTSQAITWRCHFPAEEAVDFNAVEAFRVMIVEDEEIETWDVPTLAQP